MDKKAFPVKDGGNIKTVWAQSLRDLPAGTILANVAECHRWLEWQQLVFATSGEVAGFVSHPLYRHTDHVPRQSGTPGCVNVFTQDQRAWWQGRTITLRAGRYLTKYHTYLSAARVKELAGYCNTEVPEIVFPVRLAETPDDIERVYVNGPSSCMSSSDWSSGVHPCRVYGAGALAIAWIGDDESDDHTVLARVLCRPDKQAFGRIYGATGPADALRAALHAKGWAYHPSRFVGARLLRIEVDGEELVCPYLDANLDIIEDGDYLRVAAPGDGIRADSTEGTITLEERSPYVCDNCNERCDEVSEVYVSGRRSQEWCEGCVDDHAWYCEHDGHTYSDDVESVTSANGESMPLEDADALVEAGHMWVCSISGEYVHWERSSDKKYAPVYVDGDLEQPALRSALPPHTEFGENIDDDGAPIVCAFLPCPSQLLLPLLELAA